MNLFAIASQFRPDRQIIEVKEYGSGNLNDTFRVIVDDVNEKYFILQRINTNMQIFTDHVRARLNHHAGDSTHGWQVPNILRAQDGNSHYIDAAGGFWRAITFIGASRTFDQVRNLEHASQVGYALGKFQSLISDLETLARYAGRIPYYAALSATFRRGFSKK